MLMSHLVDRPGGFADMFVCVHENMHPGYSDPMDPHRVLSTASSTLWISLCIKGLCTVE